MAVRAGSCVFGIHEDNVMHCILSAGGLTVVFYTESLNDPHPALRPSSPGECVVYAGQCTDITSAVCSEIQNA